MAPDESEILVLLATILDASRGLLAQAREENWDAFADQELGRRDALSRLASILGEQPEGLPPELRSRGTPLIEEILRLDRESMALAEDRMADLGEAFQSAAVSRQLSKAYGTP